MAFVIDRVNTYFYNQYIYKQLRHTSEIAIAFPNKIQQDGPRFNTAIQIPVMTPGITQDNWDPRTGFTQTYTTDEVVNMVLKQNFTLYNRISKVDVQGENWAQNKATMVSGQRAWKIDDYVQNELDTKVTEKIDSPVELTKDNIVKELARFKKFLRARKISHKQVIFGASADIVALFTDLDVSVTRIKIEDTSLEIIDALKLKWMELPDIKLNQIIAFVPQAACWGLAVDIPLSVGQYTQGEFNGQYFVNVNEFYDFAIIQPQFVIAYPVPTPPSQESSKKGKGSKGADYQIDTSNLPNKDKGKDNTDNTPDNSEETPDNSEETAESTPDTPNA